MAKSIIKKSFSVLLAMIICVGFMSITAFANEAGEIHLLGAKEGLLAKYNFTVVDEYKPAAGDERYAVVGAGEQTEFWTAYLFTSGATPEEEPVAVIDDLALYNRGGGRNIRGIYLDGEIHSESTIFIAPYNGLQQGMLMNGNGKKVAVYCADHVTSSTTEARYRVVNIEDATHYDKETAAKIRAVAANGYWGGTESVDQYGTLAKVKALMANAKDADNKNLFTQEEIDLLSPGVALSATQFAIWELANANDDRQVVNVQYIEHARVTGVNGNGWNKLNPTPAAEVPCVDLIFKLSHYLTQLAPMSPAELNTGNTVLTDKVILRDVDIEVVEKAASHDNNADTNKDNDAYVTNVTFDMLPVSKNDSLYAKLVDAEGNLYATGRIVGKLQDGEVQLINNNNGTYTFPNITLVENEETTYTVVVEGVQCLERNVYLYTAGDRETSQTMIGYDEGEFTVDVESIVKKTFNVDDPTVVINKVDEKGNALTGAKFALYAEDGTPIGEYPVDADGKISIEDLAPGAYKLVETKAPYGYIGAAEPMYFVVVGTDSEDGVKFEVREEFVVEYDDSYEISNHVFYPAIPQNFVLLNAANDKDWNYKDAGEYVFGKSNYQVVYCGDSTTGLEDGTRYVKADLDKCFPETADKLRAVVVNSYPYVSVEEMGAASGIENLTRGDVIAAVQLAIWNLTNGDTYTYRDATYSVPDYAKKWGGAYHDYTEELPDYLKDLKGTTTKIKDEKGIARVDALYNYLFSNAVTAEGSDLEVNFYVAVGGKDASQSLIGAGIRGDFYTDGLNIYVKNAKGPSVSFESGKASNISFMLLDKATGEVEFLNKIDIGGETSFDIPCEAGKVSVVFIKQSTSGMFWFSEEVSEELQNAAIACLKANNPSYKGHDAIAFGGGDHELEFKKNKFATYSFDMGGMKVETENKTEAVTEDTTVEAPVEEPVVEETKKNNGNNKNKNKNK